MSFPAFTWDPTLFFCKGSLCRPAKSRSPPLPPFPLEASLAFTEFCSLDMLDFSCLVPFSLESSFRLEDSASINLIFVDDSCCLRSWFSFTSSTFFLYNFFKMSSSILDCGRPSGPFASAARPATTTQGVSSIPVLQQRATEERRDRWRGTAQHGTYLRCSRARSSLFPGRRPRCDALAPRPTAPFASVSVACPPSKVPTVGEPAGLIFGGTTWNSSHFRELIFP